MEYERDQTKKRVGPESPCKPQDSSTRFSLNKTFPKESPPHEKEMSDISNNNNNERKSIYIYNIYSQLKDVQARERRLQFNTTYSPSIYKEFRKTVHETQPYNVTANRVLEDFMIDYIVKNLEDQKQPKITQFFIKAEQVNIAKKQVVVEKPLHNINYSELSLEKLQDHYDKARALNQMGKIQTIAFELKKRGIRP